MLKTSVRWQALTSPFMIFKIKIWSKPEGNSDWACVSTIKCTEAITAVDFAPRLIDDK
jgi:hypothetical protein